MSYQVLQRVTGRRETRRVDLPIVGWKMEFNHEVTLVQHPVTQQIFIYGEDYYWSGSNCYIYKLDGTTVIPVATIPKDKIGFDGAEYVWLGNVTVAYNGDFLIAGGISTESDYTLRGMALIRFSDGVVTKLYQGTMPECTIRGIAAAPDGRLIVCAQYHPDDCKILQWDNSGGWTTLASGSYSNYIARTSSMAFSSDGVLWVGSTPPSSGKIRSYTPSGVWTLHEELPSGVDAVCLDFNDVPYIAGNGFCKRLFGGAWVDSGIGSLHSAYVFLKGVDKKVALALGDYDPFESNALFVRDNNGPWGTPQDYDKEEHYYIRGLAVREDFVYLSIGAEVVRLKIK